MAWLERVRQKKYTHDTPGSDKSAKSGEVATSVTFGTGLGIGPEVFSEPPYTTPEVIAVAYQKISYDWAIADGTYTPQQLRKAKVVVKPWGDEQTCLLTWGASVPGDAVEAISIPQTHQVAGEE